MKYFITLLKNARLKIKFNLIILSSISFISLISFIAINHIINTNNDLLQETTASALIYSSNNIEQTLSNIDQISTLLLSDTNIQENLDSLYETTSQLKLSLAYSELYRTILSYSYLNPYITTISLFYEDITISSNTHKSTLPETVRSYLVEEAAKNKGGSTYKSLNSYQDAFVLIREIKKIKGLSLNHLGTLVIYIDISKLIKDSTNYNNSFDFAYYRLQSEGIDLYQSEQLDISKYLKILKKSDNYQIIKSNNGTFFVVDGKIPKYEWDYECYVEYDNIYSTVNKTSEFYFILISLCVIICILISTTLINNIIDHINKIIEKIHIFRKKQFVPKLNSTDYTKRFDEIGILHRHFDQMTNEIQSLINDNYKANLLRKDAQLKSLEQQINPHFLYNTLESINWRAKSIGEKQISSMVESLGKLLRATLDDSTSDIPLRKELEMVDNYITIQKYRFEDRLIFESNISERLLSFQVPKLCIQPIIENAIKYSVEETIDDCYIYLNGEIVNDSTHIIIKNTGSQFKHDLLNNIFNKEITPQGLGIGLSNIDTRIKLRYGESYGLTLKNEDEMAVVIIKLPLQI